MKKLALTAGAALIVVGSAGSADAQFRYRHGWHGGWGSHHYYGYRRSGWNGGALAAGLVGGAILGGIVSAAAAPAYAYPAYPYGYGYGYGYGYAPAYYGGYYPAPVYPRAVYAPAPFYGPRLVWRQSNPYRAYYAY